MINVRKICTPCYRPDPTVQSGAKIFVHSETGSPMNLPLLLDSYVQLKESGWLARQICGKGVYILFAGTSKGKVEYILVQSLFRFRIWFRLMYKFLRMYLGIYHAFSF